MTQTISMPLWAFVLILLFAAVTFASHFLLPSVRWFFRKRAERVIAKLNTRLQRPIEPFKLARRYDMIQRLIYDPAITHAVHDYAAEESVPESVAFEKARTYAREIVPSFSATAYFSIGTRLAKWLSRSLYRIRLGTFEREDFEALDPNATVIFVINHRSNMDYVLVTYLAARAGALSYAVGEWARVWPLSAVIRAMGAYFIRRKSRGALYRKVLARYVQMATAGGVSQAVFPEGRLSVTGAIDAPKLGLLSYIVGDFKHGGRDVVFVPAALNYDRVLEDRFLIKADKSGERRFRPPLWTVLRGTGVHLWARLTRRFKKFGTAAVSFGAPLKLSDFAAGRSGDFTDALGVEMMQRIARVVPVLSVPLVARILLEQGPMTRAALIEEVARVKADLVQRDIPAPRREPLAVVDAALTALLARGALRESGEEIAVNAAEIDLVAYYARSISHHFNAGAAEISATAR
ncbi:MAG: 1-acyl-sn-glycerol-3-phosphate acyltransferase [Yoonia sp.]|nr:1-acyl-sn-glycerol-3-phosphate acyltransferase [Yoonia sp.]